MAAWRKAVQIQQEDDKARKLKEEFPIYSCKVQLIVILLSILSNIKWKILKRVQPYSPSTGVSFVCGNRSSSSLHLHRSISRNNKQTLISFISLIYPLFCLCAICCKILNDLFVFVDYYIIEAIFVITLIPS